MGDPDVSGLFIDDAWNTKGLTEEGPGWQDEMELAAVDLAKMQQEYQTTITAVHKKAVAQGGYSTCRSSLLGFSAISETLWRSMADGAAEWAVFCAYGSRP